MSKAERRHDKLAIRLSLIISRLMAGDTLVMTELAAEFGVSERTLRRDLRERLIYHDLVYSNGTCRLRSGSRIEQRELDILMFMQRTGLSGIFPHFDRQLISVLMECEEPPCLVWHNATVKHSPAESPFLELIKAILANKLVVLFAEGKRYEHIAPYRLVALEEIWYLVALHQAKPTVFKLDEIQVVQTTTEGFKRKAAFYQLSGSVNFIKALPYFRAIQHSLEILALP